jgi:hypothetical protein
MSSFLRKVVRNDAMKEDPPEIYGWRVYALAVSVMAPSLPLRPLANNFRPVLVA